MGGQARQFDQVTLRRRSQLVDQPLELGGIHRQARQFLELLTALLIRQLGGRARQHPGRPGRAAPDQAQRLVQWETTRRPRRMIIISSQREPAQDTEHFAGPVGIAMLARLGSGRRHRHLGEQAFQQLAAIRQQGGAQSAFDPLGGQRLAVCQSLLKQFQEGFRFLAACRTLQKAILYK